ncbi:MAG: MotA/TolQ/ExbB proton channel family protein [Gemmatimonadota bacterium]|nr:MotA/TolQ/ExbB proton channel family protein [Gemmatimonadota bacterium]HEU4989027.1 MotA/TolQ/ExbB proton channel family protein [Gemmatimonadaceae bacterium]
MILGFFQIGGAIPNGALDLIMSAALSTKIVLSVLAVLSLLSWAIMLGAWRQLGKAERAALAFQHAFESAPRLDEAGALVKRSKPGALPRLFLRALHFVSEARIRNQQAREMAAMGATPAGGATYTLSATQIETLRLLLDAEAAEERDRLGRYLPWLATTGSASPLIGLFGTVLGVIEAFLGIASKGSGNLGAVAPGVAEALIATAAALAVAIPATFGYNIFANKLNRFDAMMENFSTDVIALLAREGHI